MKKKVHLGQELKVPKTHEEKLSQMQKQSNANIETINDISMLIKARKDRMWEIIKQILPETEEYNCQYNSKNHTVKMISKIVHD